MGNGHRQIGRVGTHQNFVFRGLSVRALEVERG